MSWLSSMTRMRIRGCPAIGEGSTRRVHRGSTDLNAPDDARREGDGGVQDEDGDAWARMQRPKQRPGHVAVPGPNQAPMTVICFVRCGLLKRPTDRSAVAHRLRSRRLNRR